MQQVKPKRNSRVKGRKKVKTVAQALQQIERMSNNPNIGGDRELYTDYIYGVLQEALSENRAKPSDGWKSVLKKAESERGNGKTMSTSKDSNNNSSGSFGNAPAALLWANSQKTQKTALGDVSLADWAREAKEDMDNASTAAKGASNG